MEWIVLALYLCGMIPCLRFLQESDVGDGSTEFKAAVAVFLISWPIAAMLSAFRCLIKATLRL
jgi:hypothetical protein